MELVCPAGNFPSLKAAVINGADAVYLGFKDETNARNFSGLNFNDTKLEKSLTYARDRNIKIYVAINTYPQPAAWHKWQAAIDRAADIGVNAVIVADIGVMDYAVNKYPDLNLHLSVQGSATNVDALNFYYKNFNIKRAVIPRVLALPQINRLAEKSPVDLEVFAFGSLCIMAEGRCHLSSYITGESPNMCGVCSPASAVAWKNTGDVLETRLNNVLIDRYEPDENAGYPTLCKGRFKVGDNVYHTLEEPTSLNTLSILPELHKIGVKALKIEGRQRSPAYVGQVVKVWREAIDAYTKSPELFSERTSWQLALNKVSEGSQTTLGAYSRPWQ
ncbi:MAG: U32 family peptidase [Gammaproteobacteria bacterium]|nr:U32 family peptidase [Gammaproteobacteria bacterium]